jgi:exopolysaccharide production protein ExoZ
MAEPAARGGHKLGILEVGRFIAAAIVVLDHVQTSLVPHDTGQTAKFYQALHFPGSLAVQFFFVLSGFVMMTAHYGDFGNAAAVPRFWWRRACRIYPMYWIALALPLYLFHPLVTPGLLARLVTLQPVFGYDYVPPAWSLRYEISFYILFGLCLLPRFGVYLLYLWVAAVTWVALPVVVRHFFHIPPPHALVWLAFHGFSGFLVYFDFYFFAGLAGGWLFLKKSPGNAICVAMIVLGLAGQALTMPLTHWGHAFGEPMVASFSGASFAAIITGFSMLERNGTLRTGRLARRLGAMSYPLYILHAPILLLFDRHMVGLNLQGRGLWEWSAVMLAVIYAVSAVCTFYVDQPMQRLLRRWPKPAT